MSATLPPGAELERPSDFGEFWQRAEAAPKPPSVMPAEEETEPPMQALTPEQHARRQRFRRAVSGVVLGLLAFTALATCIYAVKSRAAARSEALDEKAVTAASGPALDGKPVAASAEAGRASAPSAAKAGEQVAPSPALSATDQVLALAREPVATAANLQTFSQHAGQLNTEDRRRAEHDLSRLSVTGARPAQEAARLELAILWRATARRAKAQKVLVSLARTATDPLVRKYALDTLSAA